MKIAFLNDLIYAYASQDSSAIGGAERQQWLLGRALATRGWSVIVGVRDALQSGEHRSIEEVEFVGIGQGQVLMEWHKLFSSERPDWWYWRGADHILGPAFELARLSRVKTIFSASFDSDVHPCRALSRRTRWWPFYAWGLARADKIFLQHMGQFTELTPQWRSKAHIVPGISGGTIAVQSHYERAKYVAWVGQLRQPKRPELFIDIARKAPTIQFVICGSPAIHRSPPGYGNRIVEELRALPNVEYLGRVDPEKAHRIIAEAAMLLSTSDGEGFPNTFLQAWASGTPVVSLNIDPDQVIQRLGLGTISATVEAAIADIHRLMDSPQQREEMATRARQHVAETHSEAAVIRAFTRAVDGITS